MGNLQFEKEGEETMTLTEERLAAIKKIRAAIMPGIWKVHAEFRIQSNDGDDYTLENAYFIAAAPQIVDELLAEIERLQMVVQNYKDTTDAVIAGNIKAGVELSKLRKQLEIE